MRANISQFESLGMKAGGFSSPMNVFNDRDKGLAIIGQIADKMRWTLPQVKEMRDLMSQMEPHLETDMERSQFQRIDKAIKEEYSSLQWVATNVGAGDAW